MKETITGSFYKKLNIAEKPIQVRGILLEEVGRPGTEGDIGFYELEVLGEQRSKVMEFRYCIKEVNIRIINRCPESSPKFVLRKYLSLKEAKLPVTPFMRFDPINNWILMTDMTNNGMFEIIDKHNPRRDGFEIINTDSIKEEALRAGRIAFSKNIFLYHDAYAVIVNKQTHLGDLCLLDIGRRTQFVNFCYAEERAEEEVEMFTDWVF